jgi:tRNA(adenine34) deaminase
MDYETIMHLALDEARKSGLDVPVGAIVLDSTGKVLASNHNQKEAKADAASHAEIEAIRSAGEKLGDWRLDECTLVVTLEPCVMCAGAIVAARLKRVVFGAWDRKAGAGGSIYDILRDSRLGKPVEVFGGVLEQDSTALIEGFFRGRRLN